MLKYRHCNRLIYLDVSGVVAQYPRDQAPGGLGGFVANHVVNGIG